MNETALLKIRIFGDPILRTRAAKVEKVTDCQRELLDKMAKLMYAGSGIGLAAPQAGINAAMIVVDAAQHLYKLINPKIVKRQGRQVLEEGCLSIPGVCIKVKRAKCVIIKAQNENGEPLTIEAEDLLACVIQHEIDHLKGRLIVDYASFFEKLKIRKKIEELRKSSKNERLYQAETKYCKLQL
jgi:peptide deformylase